MTVIGKVTTSTACTAVSEKTGTIMMNCLIQQSSKSKVMKAITTINFANNSSSTNTNTNTNTTIKKNPIVNRTNVNDNNNNNNNSIIMVPSTKISQYSQRYNSTSTVATSSNNNNRQRLESLREILASSSNNNPTLDEFAMQSNNNKQQQQQQQQQSIENIQIDTFRHLQQEDVINDNEEVDNEFVVNENDIDIDNQNNTIIKKINKKAPIKSTRVLAKPKWLKGIAVTDPESKYWKVRDTVRQLGLATVCEEAKCPNIGECWSGDTTNNGVGATATIMIMGDTCTRGCRFCSVSTSKTPAPLDPLEPEKVSTAISLWGLDYIVLTSVDRDDILPDQGSLHFRNVVQQIKEKCTNNNHTILVEALTPDFQGQTDLIYNVTTSGVDVFAHNVETVQRLTSRVRDHRASYVQSLNVLQYVNNLISSNTTNTTTDIPVPQLTKTSIMLGLGETDDEIKQTLIDIRNVGVNVITLGQYLQPTTKHLKVQNYVSPEQFLYWEQYATNELHFTYVASGPLVRSSYKAGEYFIKNYLNKSL